MASLFTYSQPYCVFAGWHIMSFYVAKKNAKVSLRSNASLYLSFFLFPFFLRFSSSL